MDDNYFDEHWQLHGGNKIPSEKIKVAKEFIRPVYELNNLDKKNILDVGCGDGVHYVVIKGENKTVAYTGIDISDNVISSLKDIYHDDTQATFDVGDALNLQFSDSTYDVVFSFGVLGYTQNPEDGFLEMIRVCKTGGKIGLWLYPRKKGLLGAIFNLIRLLSASSSDFFKRRIADLIVPLLYFLPTRSGLNLSNATWVQCREVVMVNIAPQDLVFFDKEDILRWFNENGVRIDVDDNENEITIWGTKL
jgi:SAM-dependent methyltransferase